MNISKLEDILVLYRTDQKGSTRLLYTAPFQINSEQIFLQLEKESTEKDITVVSNLFLSSSKTPFPFVNHEGRLMYYFG